MRLTEGVFLGIKYLKFIMHAYSFSRLRRQLPLGGSLSYNTFCVDFFVCILFIGRASIEPRDYRVVSVLQKETFSSLRKSLFLFFIYQSLIFKAGTTPAFTIST